MIPIQLTRRLDNKLYARKIEAVIEENFGSSLIYLNPFSVKKLRDEILKKAGIFGANAYEFCGAKLSDWTGEYSGSFSFYRIEKTNSKIKRNGQLELDF